MLDSSVIALALRLVVSLAVVIGLMFLFAGALRKRGIIVAGGGAAGRVRRSPLELEIVSRRPLGRNAQLAVVRTAGKTLVLGITEHQVTMLAEADKDYLDGIALDAPDDADDIDLGTYPSEAQRTALQRTAPSGSFPTWKTLIEGVRDRTVRR